MGKTCQGMLRISRCSDLTSSFLDWTAYFKSVERKQIHSMHFYEKFLFVPKGMEQTSAWPWKSL